VRLKSLLPECLAVSQKENSSLSGILKLASGPSLRVIARRLETYFDLSLTRRKIIRRLYLVSSTLRVLLPNAGESTRRPD
tara:strand:- start:259 stop:498 length:240 start_codon:yes stop_codon:yes gene_type:complete